MYFVLIEASGFDYTIGDTNDLSTMRGGSRALLHSPGLILKSLLDREQHNGSSNLSIETIFDGASRALISVSGDANEAELRQKLNDCIFKVAGSHAGDAVQGGGGVTSPVDLSKSDPETSGHIMRHILPSVKIDIAIVNGDTTESFSQSLCRLENQLLREKLSSYACDRPSNALKFDGGSKHSGGELAPCTMDRVRPANALYFSPGEKPTPYNQFTALRRKLGRGSRRIEYYKEQFGIDSAELAGKNIDYSDSFEEIVAHAPIGNDIIANKMGVLYFDGNLFGQFFAENSQSAEQLKSASGAVAKMRAELLQRLFDKWLKIDGFYLHQNSNGRVFSEPKFRLETLLWGGDEAMMVFPAWQIHTVLRDLSDELDKKYWSYPGADEAGTTILTNSIGLLICSYKFPIRDARNLAERLADGCKAHPDGGKKNLIQILNLQGVLDMPTRQLSDERSQLLNIDEADQSNFFTLEFDQIGNWLDGLGEIRNGEGDNAEGLARGKMVQSLQYLIERGHLCGDKNEEGFRESKKHVAELLSLGTADSPMFKYLCQPVKADGSETSDTENFSVLFHAVKMWRLLDAALPYQKPCSDKAKSEVA